MHQKVIEAVNYINSKTKNFQPEIAIVLGSGLGDFANSVRNSTIIPYSEIPNFPTSSVEGHVGQLVFGEIEDKKVVIMQGRIHYYEGYAMPLVVFPEYVLASLGAKTLILTNAVGSLNPKFQVNEFVAVKDHINFTGYNPLIGHNYDFIGIRFLPLNNLYSKRILNIIASASKELSIPVHEGVFAQLTGPSFETPAEINFLSKNGIDTVGMSSAIEAIAGLHAGMEIACISLVTNLASGVCGSLPNHQEVLANGIKSKSNFLSLLNYVVKNV